MNEVWKNLLGGWLGKLFGGVPARRKERKIQLCDTLSFGDRRFIALVNVDGQKFLVGGAGSSISLLTSLPVAATPVAPTEVSRGIKIFK